MARQGKHNEYRPKPTDLKDLGSYENVVNTFKRYDTNRDNKLSLTELHQLMVDLNRASRSGFNWTQNNTELLLNQLDRNQNDGVDMDELIAYVFPRGDAMGGTAGASNYEIVLEQFRKHDTNRNGTLDKPEFTRLMEKLKPGWRREDTERVFDAVDKDRSGEVESDELVAWLFGVPADRRRAGRQARRADRRGQEPAANAAPLVVVDFVCGEGGQSQRIIERITRKWEEKLGNQVMIRTKVEGPPKGAITKVTARGGAVVFWDSASMMAYRENPFLDQKSADDWSKDMIARHIPRLISGT